MKPTTQDKIRCLERELALRKNVYPKRIKAGKMSRDEANREFLTLQAIRRDYDREDPNDPITTAVRAIDDTARAWVRAKREGDEDGVRHLDESMIEAISILRDATEAASEAHT